MACVTSRRKAAVVLRHVGITTLLNRVNVHRIIITAALTATACLSVLVVFTSKCTVYTAMHYPVWLDSLVVRAMDWRSTGHGFHSHPLCCRVRRRTSRSHTHASVTKRCFVLAKGRRWSEARKPTVGLASHWPCVTDSAVYTTCGLK